MKVSTSWRPQLDAEGGHLGSKPAAVFHSFVRQQMPHVPLSSIEEKGATVFNGRKHFSFFSSSSCYISRLWYFKRRDRLCTPQEGRGEINGIANLTGFRINPAALSFPPLLVSFFLSHAWRAPVNLWGSNRIKSGRTNCTALYSSSAAFSTNRMPAKIQRHYPTRKCPWPRQRNKNKSRCNHLSFSSRWTIPRQDKNIEGEKNQKKMGGMIRQLAEWPWKRPTEFFEPSADEMYFTFSFQWSERERRKGK